MIDRGSPKTLRFILRGTSMSTQDFMAIYSIFVEIFSQDQPTNVDIPESCQQGLKCEKCRTVKLQKKLDLTQEPSVNTSVRHVLMGQTHSFSDE